MNVFYTEPANITGNQLELKGQEAKHATKVLRNDVGDTIYVGDGLGKLYTCEIINTTKKSIFTKIYDIDSKEKPQIKKALAFGAIKKRDRLEFAVEKAVELNAWEICIFHADHSERSRINRDRLQSIVLSAFKQSKRYWLPKIVYLDSMDEVLNHYPDFKPVLAHMDAEVKKPAALPARNNLLLIGPEGGFSDREVALARNNEAVFISLGKTRLRAETAVVTMLSQYIFTE